MFFLPFYIFIHEKDLSVYNEDEKKRKILMDEYKYIIQELEVLYQAGEIGEIEFQCIITSGREVLRLLAKKYSKILEEGERIMGGELLDYPAKRSLKEGIQIGIDNSVKKLLSKHKTVEEVAELLDLDINKVKEIEKTC